MADVITTITNFLKDYALALVLVLVVGIGLLIRRRRAKKKLAGQKKQAKKLGTDSEKEITPPTKPQTQQPQIEQSFAERFSDTRLRKKEPEDIVEKIVSIGDDVDKSTAEIQSRLKNDFEKLRTELIETSSKKTQIREQGLKLANLYDQYSDREQHIVIMMQDLEQMIRRKESETFGPRS